jgi:isoleucyl-tRNA synthetase
VIDKFINFVAKEGSDSWFIRGLKDFLPAGFTCPHCKGGNLTKGTDILDVWFDSGVSSQAVLKKRPELEFPAALYLEGSDQHRGWFQSSLIPAVCIDGSAPFKNVLTHGFVVDGEGRKMSKSQGNVISPFDIIKDYGADILRLWVASSDYNEDIRISKEIMLRLSEAYRKVRNTARFILSNLYDFDPQRDRVDYKKMNSIDTWILSSFNSTLKETSAAYEEFQFHKAYKEIYDFCNEQLSMYYLDMVKGRLYTYGHSSLERRSAQTVIYDILYSLVRLMAPIFVFTADEIWKCMPKYKNDSDITSVHILSWPSAIGIGESNLDAVISLIPEVAKALEEKRAKGEIGSSFDAQINLLTKDEIRYNVLASLKDELPEVFKVSSVNIEKVSSLESEKGLVSKAFGDLAVIVRKADGVKCVRCWNYSLSTGESAKHPLICSKCEAAVSGEEK